MSSPEHFDDGAYRHGVASFEAGMSLREMCEIVARSTATNSASGEARSMSFVLGFADAALNALRQVLNP